MLNCFECYDPICFLLQTLGMIVLQCFQKKQKWPCFSMINAVYACTLPPIISPCSATCESWRNRLRFGDNSSSVFHWNVGGREPVDSIESGRLICLLSPLKLVHHLTSWKMYSSQIGGSRFPEAPTTSGESWKISFQPPTFQLVQINPTQLEKSDSTFVDANYRVREKKRHFKDFPFKMSWFTLHFMMSGCLLWIFMACQ